MTENPGSLITKALAPIIGGAGKELSGLIGDQIRFYRWRNALQIIERARRYARTQNIPASDIPLKFLIPYLEAASLEDAGDQSKLPDMWAQLLASSVQQYESRYNMYIDILRKLSSDDAKGIHALYRQFNKDELFRDEGFDPDVWNFNDIEDTRKSLQYFVDGFCEEALSYFSQAGVQIAFFKLDWDKRCQRALKGLGGRVDVKPICYSMNFYYGDERMNGYSSVLKLKEITFDSTMSCVALGIFERFEAAAVVNATEDRAKKVRFNLSLICLSSIGLDFMRTVCRHGSLTSKRRSS